MKYFHQKALLLASIMYLLGACSESATNNSSYDGKTYDVSKNNDSSLVVKSNKNGNYYELAISGSGEAIDFSSRTEVPWNPIIKKVNKLIIEENVKYIGDYFFNSLNFPYHILPKSITSIGEHSFNESSIIYTYGSKLFDSNNIYYFSENTPTQKGNYFHIVDGVPTIWTSMLTDVSVLFIGNSFTYKQGTVENPAVPAYFSKILKNFDLNSTIDFVVKGSYKLVDYANPNDEMGAIVESKLTSNQYDFIILQEQSTTPINNYNTFNNAVKKLKTRISQTQKTAKVVLYETWGSPTAIAGTDFKTCGEMEMVLRKAYETSATENGCQVNYVGKVFTYVYETLNINIYSEDNRHQSNLGAYLSAATHARSLFGFDMTKCTEFTDFTQSECAPLLGAVNHEI